MATLSYTDSTAVLAGRGTATITFTLQRDGSALNLTGHAVTGTIRAWDNNSVPINSSLESVSLTNVTPASGIMLLSFTDAMLLLLQKPDQVVAYEVQLYVADFTYYPNPYKMYVRYAPH